MGSYHIRVQIFSNSVGCELCVINVSWSRSFIMETCVFTKPTANLTYIKVAGFTSSIFVFLFMLNSYSSQSKVETQMFWWFRAIVWATTKPSVCISEARALWFQRSVPRLWYLIGSILPSLTKTFSVLLPETRGQSVSFQPHAEQLERRST